MTSSVFMRAAARAAPVVAVGLVAQTRTAFADPTSKGGVSVGPVTKKDEGISVAGFWKWLNAPSAPIRPRAPRVDPSKTSYTSPFSDRYGSEEMRGLFSQETKFSTWREIWVALAKAQQQLGLPITDEQIAEMAANVHNIDWAMAEQIEGQIGHDVMSHVRTFGAVCPKAAGIIHLGATSCVVTDNTDVMLMRKALGQVEAKLVTVMKGLAEQAKKYRDVPCLAYTHGQPAQPTTVGKRYCEWLQDFEIALKAVRGVQANLKCLGIKGATGTQDSFLKLFEGDHEKVKELERLVAANLGFSPDQIFPISGQTYSRSQDVEVFSALSLVGIAASRMATDIRLLAHSKQQEEPFGAKQVGSSAMPYKRNPERLEGVCSLARGVFSHHQTMVINAASQWFERTLDDSANRRFVIPEGFLAVDEMLRRLTNVAAKGVVHEKVIARRLEEELPFMATESIMMRAVAKGSNRQEMHERLRVLSQLAGDHVKRDGLPNDLLDLIAADPAFGLTRAELDAIIKDTAQFIGRAPQQVDEYLAGLNAKGILA